MPTETVYGLAASIDNPLAIRQIFALKERPINHPLIIHASSIEMASDMQSLRIKRSQSDRVSGKALTLILPKKNMFPMRLQEA